MDKYYSFETIVVYNDNERYDYKQAFDVYYYLLHDKLDI